MAEPVKQANSSELMTDAMQLMRDALRLLDQASAPADVGAHLDLAIERLAPYLHADDNGG